MLSEVGGVGGEAVTHPPGPGRKGQEVQYRKLPSRMESLMLRAEDPFHVPMSPSVRTLPMGLGNQFSQQQYALPSALISILSNGW